MIVTNGATLKWGWSYVAARAAYPVLVRSPCSETAAVCGRGLTRLQCEQRNIGLVCPGGSVDSGSAWGRLAIKATGFGAEKQPCITCA